jgi:hypothetical protein
MYRPTQWKGEQGRVDRWGDLERYRQRSLEGSFERT